MHSTRQYVGRVLTLLTAKAKRKSWQNGRTLPPPGVRLCALEIPLIRIDLCCRPLRSQDRTTAEARALLARGTSPVSQGIRPGQRQQAQAADWSPSWLLGVLLHCPPPRSGESRPPGTTTSSQPALARPWLLFFSGTRHSRLDGREIGHFRLLGPAPATGSLQQHLFIRLAPAAHHRRHSQAPMPQTSTRSIADPSPHPRLGHWFCEASHARHHSFFRSTDLPGFARASRRLHHFLISPLQCWSVVSSTGHGLYHPSLPSSKPTWSGTDKGSTLRLTASSRRPPPLRAPRHYNNPAPTEMGNH